mgnify:CR=1 FL=1
MTLVERQNDLICKLRCMADEAYPGSSCDLAMDCVREIKRCQRLEVELKEAIQAMRGLLMCSLPQDISGRRMVDDARDVIDKYLEDHPDGT